MSPWPHSRIAASASSVGFSRGTRAPIRSAASIAANAASRHTNGKTGISQRPK
jgi:hypothetical protein